jgi:hypothetical protein
MRWLVLSLFMINVLMLGWNIVQPDGARAEKTKLSAGIPPIVLLEEYEGELEFIEPKKSNEPKQIVDDSSSNIEKPDEIAAVDDAMNELQEVCTTLGPLMSQHDVNQVASVLKSLGIKANSRRSEKKEVLGLWVYLRPAPTREEAERKVQDLVRSGIKDYYIVKSGENTNAISLGVFKQEEKALARINRLRAMGYDPILGRRYRTSPVYWLDFIENSDLQISDEDWKTIVRSRPGLQRLPTACNSIAERQAKN